MTRYFVLATLLAFGCNNNNGGNGNNDMAMNGGGNGDGGEGADMTPPGDMVDTTVTPAPTTMHVGATGPSGGLVTAGVTAAAYLLKPTAGSPATGDLHVTTAAGVDKLVDTGVNIGSYQLTRDGKQVIYSKTSGANGSLFWADVSGATVTPKTLFNGTYAAGTLSGGGFMAPSGHFFLAGVRASGVASSLDMHVIRMTDGADVFDRLNGGFDYLEVVLPDDTCVFQDTAGGQSTGSPPVQTLYWTALPMTGTTTTATAINTRTSNMTPSGDNKKLLYLKTNGDLYSWDAMAKTGAGTKIASSVVKYVVGGDATGPLAYIAADGSVHVQSLDGATKLLDTAASMATSFRAPLVLGPDNADVYFFQNGDLVTGGVENSTGTLMRVAVSSGATPSKIADKVSIVDLQVMDNAVLFLQNLGVPPTPPGAQFGDAAKANRDGTGITVLGMKVPVGGLQAVNPGPDTWFAMHLNTSVDDSAANTPIDGSSAVYGALSFEDYTGGAAVTLDAKVHQGAFGFALDDGRTAAYVTGGTWNATALNYVGALAFIAARSPSMKVDGMLTGVSELGPIINRSLFVNAPTATTAGVYFVKY
jgi:hypothetical protein